MINASLLPHKIARWSSESPLAASQIINASNKNKPAAQESIEVTRNTRCVDWSTSFVLIVVKTTFHGRVAQFEGFSMKYLVRQKKKK